MTAGVGEMMLPVIIGHVSMIITTSHCLSTHHKTYHCLSTHHTTYCLSAHHNTTLRTTCVRTILHDTLIVYKQHDTTHNTYQNRLQYQSRQKTARHHTSPVHNMGGTQRYDNIHTGTTSYLSTNIQSNKQAKN